MDLTISFAYPESLKSLSQIADRAFAIAREDLRRTLLRRVKSGTPIGKTGDLWAAWQATTDEYGVTLTNDCPYAQYVELGGPPEKGDGYSNWPNEGPRTVTEDGGIWSRQAVGGILAPIENDPEWLNGAVDLIVEILKRDMVAT